MTKEEAKYIFTRVEVNQLLYSQAIRIRVPAKGLSSTDC